MLCIYIPGIKRENRLQRFVKEKLLCDVTEKKYRQSQEMQYNSLRIVSRAGTTVRRARIKEGRSQKHPKQIALSINPCPKQARDLVLAIVSC